jgi:hypothetical protein
MTATVPPLFGPEMLADPYDMYARIRGPASWNEQMGLWLLTRYDDVRWALGEPRLSSTLGTSAQDSASESSHLLADMYTLVRVANPPYALTAAVLTFVARASLSVRPQRPRSRAAERAGAALVPA